MNSFTETVVLNWNVFILCEKIQRFCLSYFCVTRMCPADFSFRVFFSRFKVFFHYFQFLSPNLVNWRQPPVCRWILLSVYPGLGCWLCHRVCASWSQGLQSARTNTQLWLLHASSFCIDAHNCCYNDLSCIRDPAAGGDEFLRPTMDPKPR